MSAIVVGEITADGSTIILIGQGPGEVLAGFAQRMQLLTPLVKNTEPRGGLQLPASWPAVVQLANALGAAWRPGPALTAWITDQVARRVARAAAGHPVTPAVVVCPASVVDSWVRHFRAWAPRWTAHAWRGTNRQRLAGAADIYVTSYETARRDAPTTQLRRAPLLALRPNGLVVDECHRIKDPSASQTQAVGRLADRVQAFVALSGTPITHHPGDLIPALQGLEPVAWPSGERWKSRYCLTVQGDYSATVLGLNPHTEPEFRTTILGRHRRVARADVIDEVPKSYVLRTVDIPEPWRTAYDDLEANMLATLPDGSELSVMDTLSQLSLLLQLACAPADMEITTEIVADPETGLPMEKQHRHAILKAPSWKVDALLEVMAEREGYAFAAFAPSRQLMMLAGAAAAAKGYRVGYVVGEQTAKQRTAYVDAFQARELDLLCCTTGAGGVGLTLSAADALVFLARPWSFVESKQAEDRAEGDASKTRGTEIVDIVARNTVESRVRKILKERAGQLSDLLKDPRIVAEVLGGASVRDLRRAS